MRFIVVIHTWFIDSMSWDVRSIEAESVKRAEEIAAAAEKTQQECQHLKEKLQHTGDGTPVWYCPDCGRNRAEKPRLDEESQT